MVKVSGGGKSKGAPVAHLRYIDRITSGAGVACFA